MWVERERASSLSGVSFTAKRRLSCARVFVFIFRFRTCSVLMFRWSTDNFMVLIKLGECNSPERGEGKRKSQPHTCGLVEEKKPPPDLLCTYTCRASLVGFFFPSLSQESFSSGVAYIHDHLAEMCSWRESCLFYFPVLLVSLRESERICA